MWAVIGGTGFEKSDHVEVVEELDRRTPFGDASSGLKRIKLGQVELLFVPRHGTNHELLPSEVNYRANVFALKRYGARRLLSLSTIGSLDREVKPGDSAVPRQYIDRTKGSRKHTFCGGGVVGHVSLAHPICPACEEHVKALAQGADCTLHFDKTYLCMEGPAFSTKAESVWYRSMGAQLIGMTAYPEYALAREAGMCYLPCCFVSDYDCWDDSIPHVTIQEILDVMHKNNGRAYRLAARIVSQEVAGPCECAEGGLKSGLMTPRDKLPERLRGWLEVVCR